MGGREGSDKRKQGLWGGAVQSSVGIGADLWERSVRAISGYPCVCTAVSVSGWGGAQKRLCIAGLIHGVARVAAWLVC